MASSAPLSSSAAPSSSSGPRCGDGVRNGTDLCDGSDVGPSTCFEFGFRQPSGSELRCTSDCRAFDTTQCGPRIATMTDLLGAVVEAQALAGHEIIRVPTGTYVGMLLIQPSCSNCPQDGVTIEPLDGPVAIKGGGGTCILVKDGRNILNHLELLDCPTAVLLEMGNPTAGENIVIGMQIFLDGGYVAGPLIHVRSPLNTIRANRILHLTADPLSDGILVENAHGNRIIQNILIGPGDGIALSTITDNSAPTLVDNNTVILTSTTAGTEMLSAKDVTTLCLRNNIFARTANSTEPGLRLDVGVSQGNLAECNGVRSSRNTVTGSSAACSGASCSQLCETGNNPFCDVTGSPMFVGPLVDACLGASSALIDLGVDVGADHVDDDPLRFRGAFPDMGAREVSSRRFFASYTSTCP